MPRGSCKALPSQNSRWQHCIAFTTKWQPFSGCDLRALVGTLETRGFQEENVGATREKTGGFSLSLVKNKGQGSLWL